MDENNEKLGGEELEEEYNPDVVSVIDEDGVEHFFEELDRIEDDDGKYVALIPIYDDAQDILDDDGELIILKVEEEDGETYLCPIEVEEEFNRINKIFIERLSDNYLFE
ncbi:MAG: DUF1292 domain-containing protein [Clostridia bacterium]|nr:DUF1292 domain-containing protein [Clostridia bacterium]